MKESARIKDLSAPHVVKYGPLKKNAYVTCKKVTGIAIIDPVSRELVKFHQDNAAPQEVTYHGVEMVYPDVVLAANEGRSYLDSVGLKGGKLLDRLTDVSKPCCVERVPGGVKGGQVRVLVSNIGDGTLQLVEG